MMGGRLAANRVAPIVAGLGGLLWVGAELGPQRAGFPDTDDPSAGLQFLAADPGAWALGGVALAVASIALIATVLAVRDRLLGADAGPGSTVAERTVSVVGLLAAAMLLGMAAVRLSGGPVRYVQGLDQGWGETAYLVTQFVGTQLLGTMGLALLAGWIVAVAWIGARRGVIPVPLAVVAAVPGSRLLAIPVVTPPESLWVLAMAAIPAAFLWLIALGLWRPSTRTAPALAQRPALL